MGSRIKDITGQKFGRLVVIGIAFSKKRKIHWKCKCDCGNDFIARGDGLKTGGTKSCGCYQKEQASKANFKDLSGQRFERLMAVERVGSKNGNALWKCKCDCLNDVVVPGAYLLNGNTKSCGCLTRDVCWFKPLKFGEANFNLMYSRYKQGAVKRNILFNLTKDDFRELIYKNCNYCASAPTSVWNRKILNGHIPCNGIDRVDNNKGYSSDNCVPCCSICNQAKSTLTAEEFKEWIKRLVNHNKELLD